MTYQQMRLLNPKLSLFENLKTVLKPLSEEVCDKFLTLLCYCVNDDLNSNFTVDFISRKYEFEQHFDLDIHLRYDDITNKPYLQCTYVCDTYSQFYKIRTLKKFNEKFIYNLNKFVTKSGEFDENEIKEHNECPYELPV